MDDWIILSLGECLKANGMEEIIYSGKFVKGVIVGGEGRKRPFALVELTEEGREKNVGVDDVWESVEEANKTCSCEVRIVRELVALLPEGREFKRTVKGTIPRRQNLKEFEDVIEGMYQRYEGS